MSEREDFFRRRDEAAAALAAVEEQLRQLELPVAPSELAHEVEGLMASTEDIQDRLRESGARLAALRAELDRVRQHNQDQHGP